MIWTAIDFVCRETVLHLRRERLIAIATISTTAVLMLVLGAVALFLLDMRAMTQRLGDALEISAYFERDLPREEALQKAAEIADWRDVASVQFVPREEGWEQLRTTLASGGKLEGIDNPLPDCVRVRVVDPELVAEVSAGLEGVGGVTDVVPSASESGARDSFAHKVVKTKRIITWASIVAGALVTLAGTCIIHNTIRLALHSRRREIYIMQLIGATPPIIASPFLLEGMIHGTLGATLSCCLLVPVHMYLRHLSAQSAPFVSLVPDPVLLPFTLALCATGAVLGITGSAFSVRRYLRRKPEWHR
jgi:cell division transport system permease protein